MKKKKRRPMVEGDRPPVKLRVFRKTTAQLAVEFQKKLKKLGSDISTLDVKIYLNDPELKSFGFQEEFLIKTWLEEQILEGVEIVYEWPPP